MSVRGDGSQSAQGIWVGKTRERGGEGLELRKSRERLQTGGCAAGKGGGGSTRSCSVRARRLSSLRVPEG